MTRARADACWPTAWAGCGSRSGAWPCPRLRPERFDRPLPLTLLGLVWGFAVVADSAQFSAAISELADPRYVGTALTLQPSLGFLLTLFTIRMIPPLVDRIGGSTPSWP